ncbi:MAG: BppU family phage baseplate upper protein [Gammaproteobacteria bacterium]|nr:BppU family phage baseplate upper protein [Gammaproteobacteria bacterium]
MAYSDTLNLVVGDTLPQLNLTLKDSNAAAAGLTLDPDNSATWAPIDITGATVRMRIRELGSTTVKSTLTCTITSNTGGTVHTNFPAGTLDTAGTFEAEVEITFASGGIQTVNDLIKLKVREDFD